MIDRSELASGEVRQRWRIIFARGDPARLVAQADALRLWEEAFRQARVPLAVSQGRRSRPRLAFGASLPVGMVAERELLDVVLSERLTLVDLRRRLARWIPSGYRLVELFDVWVGLPAVSAQLAAADYRALVRGSRSDELRGACADLLAARSLERDRPKGEGRAMTYDLRPLVIGLAAERGPGESTCVRMRLRHTQDGGAGRPDEVVRALSQATERELEIERLVRERLWTDDELATAVPFG